MSPPSPWIVRPKPNPQAELRLFCFSYAGAGASAFRNWWRKLPDHVELCAIQLPGRESRFREPAFTNLSSLVDRLDAEVTPFLDRPFAFFGHSMGTLVSFELARRLRRGGGRLPTHLFMSARRAPQLRSFDEPVHSLPDAAFRARLQQFSGTPSAVLDNAELFELLLPLLRADFEVVETYNYTEEPKFEVPLTAFGGIEDPLVRVQQLEAWQQQTSAGFRLCMLPGNHFFIQSAEDALVKEISKELNAAT